MFTTHIEPSQPQRCRGTFLVVDSQWLTRWSESVPNNSRGRRLLHIRQSTQRNMPRCPESPGRPLEPPQLEDLRVGRAVGPMHDREFPPHVAPVIPERPVPVPARPRFSQMKPK